MTRKIDRHRVCADPKTGLAVEERDVLLFMDKVRVHGITDTMGPMISNSYFGWGLETCFLGGQILWAVLFLT